MDTLGPVCIRIIRGESVTACDSDGKSDPFCEVGFTDDKEKIDRKNRGKTHTKENTLDPEWNQEFTLRPQGRQSRLLVKMWDRDKFHTKDFIGQVSLTYDEIKEIMDSRAPAKRALGERLGKHKDQTPTGFLHFSIGPAKSSLPASSSDDATLSASEMESGAESASDGSSWRKGKQNKKGKKHHGLSTSSSSFSDDSGTKELGDAEIEQTVLSDGGVADDGSDGMEGSKDHSTARDLVDVKHEKEEEGEEPRRSIEFPVADAEVPPEEQALRLSIKKGKNKKNGTVIEVTVVQARNLDAKDSDGTSDPFVKLQMGSSKAKTKIIKNTLFPIFNEHFSFSFPPREELPNLSVLCYDHDRFSDDFIGDFLIPAKILRELPIDEETDRWYLLQRKGSSGRPKTLTKLAKPFKRGSTVSEKASMQQAVCSGEIHLFLTYSPPTPANHGAVMVTIVECRDLKAMDKTGLSDPFVRLAVGGQKATSKICKKTLNPTFNEQFSFVVHSTDNSSAMDNYLYISVWDWDHRSKDDFIGERVIELDKIEQDMRLDLWLPLVDSHSSLFNILKLPTSDVDTVREINDILKVQEEVSMRTSAGRETSKSITQSQDSETRSSGGEDDVLDSGVRTMADRRAFFIKANKRKAKWLRKNWVYALLIMLFCLAVELAWSFL